MWFAKAVVKFRIPILIIILLLMIPSVLGMAGTRINYDMLDYLPKDMDTVIGQNELMEDFNTGAFTMAVIEDMPDKDVAKICKKFQEVEHVTKVLWFSTLADVSIPMEILPDEIYDAFNRENGTMLVIFYDTAISSDETMEAVRELRAIAGKQCFISGMSAMVTDLKDLCEKEEPIYVALSVVCACIIMLLLLDNWLIPFVFLLAIGMMILLNMGTNYFFGEISYITKALSAVLQLAVTMDYSIFLWHSYNEQRQTTDDSKEAMALAIQQTLSSVIGSSITTVAGFIALCFMSFTLGGDLGIVMAKGVILGVIGCVTVLPAMILLLDKALCKCSHRSLLPAPKRFSRGIIKIFPVFLVILVLVTVPAIFGYTKTNNEVYYDLGKCLPQDMNFVVSNRKLCEEYGVASTHLVLVEDDVPATDVRKMVDEMNQVEGVQYSLSMDSVVGSLVPQEFLPDELTSELSSDRWKLVLINSEYYVASDNVNVQVEQLNEILKKYDAGGKLIGEAPCLYDMIKTTDYDFKVVNIISVLAIFVIIALVAKSFSLPFILIAVIELAICINLGLPHFMGQSLPFIVPICISTIQLGATVDYAILMTTRYKTERSDGTSKCESIYTALVTAIPSILVSGLVLFAATFGVAIYSDIDIISSICMLIARGAIISMICVIFFLPALLMLFDGIVCRTTFGMKNARRKKTEIQKTEVDLHE